MNITRVKRLVLGAAVALALTLGGLGGLLGPVDEAAAMKCWQPDGPGTGFVCSAP